MGCSRRLELEAGDLWGCYAHNFSHDLCSVGPGVARQIENDRRHMNAMAAALSVGDWVVFDSNEDDQPVWLGRVLSNPEWDRQGVWI